MTLWSFGNHFRACVHSILVTWDVSVYNVSIVEKSPGKKQLGFCYILSYLLYEFC